MDTIDAVNTLENIEDSLSFSDSVKVYFQDWNFSLTDELEDCLNSIDKHIKRNPNNTSFLVFEKNIKNYLASIKKSNDVVGDIGTLTTVLNSFDLLVSNFEKSARLSSESNNHKQKSEYKTIALEQLTTIKNIDFFNTALISDIHTYAVSMHEHLNFLAPVKSELKKIITESTTYTQELIGCMNETQSIQCIEYDDIEKILYELGTSYKQIIDVLSTETGQMIALNATNILTYPLTFIPTPRDLLLSILGLDDYKNVINDLKELIA